MTKESRIKKLKNSIEGICFYICFWSVKSQVRLILDPLLICFVCFDCRELDDAWGLIFVHGFDGRLHDIPILYTGLVDGRNLLGVRHESFPPEYTLDRDIISTCDMPIFKELTRDTSRFWFGWMCRVDKEEWHNVMLGDFVLFGALFFVFVLLPSNLSYLIHRD